MAVETSAYFGCWNEAGHNLRLVTGRNMHGRPGDKDYPLPFSAGQLDTVFTPRGVGEDQTKTELTYVHGWTVLAMWDRSVDTRPGSNCAFLFKEQLTLEEA